MSIEIKVRIETKKINAELTQEEARELYERLREFFEAEKTTYIPYNNPLAPPPWMPSQPYYINDPLPNPNRTGYPIITYACGDTSREVK